MHAIRRFGLWETSEKTVEVNVLSDMACLLESSTGRKVTIVSPTQSQENTLGFDDIIEGLPSGRAVALQFKRPFQLRRPSNAVRFIIDTQQLQRLLNNFMAGEAFYALVPFPLTTDLLRNRAQLLELSCALDVFDIPNPRKISQNTRTIRHYTGTTLSGLSIIGVEVSDPWTFEGLERISTLKSLCHQLIENRIGRSTREQRERPRERKKLGVRRLYYLHLSSDLIPHQSGTNKRSGSIVKVRTLSRRKVTK